MGESRQEAGLEEQVSKFGEEGRVHQGLRESMAGLWPLVEVKGLGSLVLTRGSFSTFLSAHGAGARAEPECTGAAHMPEEDHKHEMQELSDVGKGLVMMLAMTSEQRGKGECVGSGMMIISPLCTKRLLSQALCWPWVHTSPHSHCSRPEGRAPLHTFR